MSHCSIFIAAFEGEVLEIDSFNSENEISQLLICRMFAVCMKKFVIV